MSPCSRRENGEAVHVEIMVIANDGTGDTTETLAAINDPHQRGEHAPSCSCSTSTSFAGLRHAHQLIAAWRDNYNPKHTNNSMLSPVDFEIRQQKLNEAGV